MRVVSSSSSAGSASTCFFDGWSLDLWWCRELLCSPALPFAFDLDDELTDDGDLEECWWRRDDEVGVRDRRWRRAEPDLDQIVQWTRKDVKRDALPWARAFAVTLIARTRPRWMLMTWTSGWMAIRSENEELGNEMALMNRRFLTWVEIGADPRRDSRLFSSDYCYGFVSHDDCCIYLDHRLLDRFSTVEASWRER